MAKTTRFYIHRLTATPFEVAWASESSWQPRVDIYQTQDATLMHVEVPGVPEERLRLHLENGRLIIEGERIRPPLPCPQHCLQVEITYGTFRRELPLPSDADGNAIQAHYQAGILQITIPRRTPQSQNVKVEIR